MLCPGAAQAPRHPSRIIRIEVGIKAGPALMSGPPWARAAKLYGWSNKDLNFNWQKLCSLTTHQSHLPFGFEKMVDSNNMSTEQQVIPIFTPTNQESTGKSSMQPTISKDSIWVRATCLLLLCCQNCIAVLAIKYNSRLPSADGKKSLSTIVIALVSYKRYNIC